MATSTTNAGINHNKPKSSGGGNTANDNVWRMRHFIDFSKFATVFVVFALIVFYGQWNNYTAWVYLGIHGSYGMCWVLKSHFFGDKTWERPVDFWLGGVFCTSLPLASYWLPPYLICSRGYEAAPYHVAASVFLFAVGVFYHFASDMQKYMHLKHAPGTLLTEGLWARLRNPNYFGEFLIYFSFALLSWHWLSFLNLAAWVGGYWTRNMINKDKSLSRYPQYKAYKKRSKALIPYLL